MQYEIAFGRDDPAVVTFTATGAADGEAFTRGVEQLVADRRFRAGMPILFDDSAADVRGISADAVKKLAQEFVRLGERLGPGRAAMLVSQPLMYGLARMFEVYASESPLTFGVFYTREDALRWLLEQRGYQPHPAAGPAAL